MSKPVIGITTSYHPTQNAYLGAFAYADAVTAAGGVPVLIPFRTSGDNINQFIDICDGFLFTGGADLNPAAWNEPVHSLAETVLADRENHERALLAAVARRGAPTLGICLGAQLLNVFRGGSLNQHLPDLNRTPTLEHRRLNDQDGRHEITVVAGTRLAAVLGRENLTVNSAHHQGVARLGAGLVISARATDGTIEAIEDPTLPLWLGVQWHPERIVSEEPNNRIFSHLVEVAGESRRRKARSGSREILAPRRRAATITARTRALVVG